MSFSSTAISYLAVSIALLTLSFRFFQYWKEKQDLTSKLFLLFGLSLSSFTLVRVFTGIFFLDNDFILLASIQIVIFFQSIVAAIAAFIVVYSKFPKASPWLVSISVFIAGLAIMFFSMKIHYEVSVQTWGAINWGFPSQMPGLLYSILRSLLLASAFIPIMLVVYSQMKRAKDTVSKRRFLGLTVVLLGGIIIGIMDFFLVDLLNIGIVYRDIMIFIVAVFLFLVVLLTQKPSGQYKEKIS